MLGRVDQGEERTLYFVWCDLRGCYYIFILYISIMKIINSYIIVLGWVLWDYFDHKANFPPRAISCLAINIVIRCNYILS